MTSIVVDLYDQARREFPMPIDIEKRMERYRALVKERHGDVSADGPQEWAYRLAAKVHETVANAEDITQLDDMDAGDWFTVIRPVLPADTHPHDEKREHRGMKNPYEFDPDAPAYAHAEGRLVKAQGWSMLPDVALRVAADIAAAAWEAAGRPEVTFGDTPEDKRTMLVRALQMRLREAQLRVEDKDHWSKRTPADSAPTREGGD